MAELIWDGKYDEHGHKRPPVRIELPFQTVETVNESVQERQRTLELSSSGHDAEWRNRLIWGDKKYVLPSLLPEFAGKVDLIYIDPPFDTGADFSFTAQVPASENDEDGEEVSFIKEPSILERKAYRDTWGRGLASYLDWFSERIVLLRELLADGGSMFVHLDWHVGHYAKTVLDDILGIQNFRNEIVWKRQSAHSDSHQCGAIHDTIFFYTKSETWVWNDILCEPGPDYIESFFDQVEKGTNRRYARGDLTGAGVTKSGSSGKPWKGINPSAWGRHWAVNSEELDRLDKEGRLHWPKKGMPRLKRYLDEFEGVPLQDIWTDIRIIHNQSQERVGYPTQKPEALLERIFEACSNESALVLDCFCGSGTTAAVAEKLNRRWIACDLGRFAIHTTRKRLLGIPDVKPFVVQNLGKYERQQWQVAEFAPSSSTVILSEAKDPMSAGAQQRPSKEFSARLSDRGENASQGRSALQADKRSFDSSTRFASESGSAAQDDRLEEQRQREAAYRKFILELYHATPVSGHVWLHGVKAGRMVHVGAVDAPVTRADVNAIAAEVWKASGKGPNSPQKPAVGRAGLGFRPRNQRNRERDCRPGPCRRSLQENSPRGAGEESRRAGRRALLRTGCFKG
jgi:DNA modification methylase